MTFASNYFIYPDSLRFHRDVLPSKLKSVLFVYVEYNLQIVTTVHFSKYMSSAIFSLVQQKIIKSLLFPRHYIRQ